MTETENYVWFRWRDKWCHSIGDWRYFELSVPKNLRTNKAREEYALKEIEASSHMDGYEVNTWSDKYRGFEVETCRPPQDVIRNKIMSLKERIRKDKEKLKRYADLVRP